MYRIVCELCCLCTLGLRRPLIGALDPRLISADWSDGEASVSSFLFGLAQLMPGLRSGYVSVPRSKRMPEDTTALRGGPKTLAPERGGQSGGAKALWVVAILLLTLLGLLLVGRLALMSADESVSEREALQQRIFVTDDYKSRHLDEEQLRGLVGLQYLRKPLTLDEMKARVRQEPKEKVEWCVDAAGSGALTIFLGNHARAAPRKDAHHRARHDGHHGREMGQIASAVAIM